MTEVERWLKKYGKATTTTKKTNTTATTNTTSTVQKVRSREEINARAKKALDDVFSNLETPEEKLKRQMDKVPPDYHPGIHTKNITLPIYRSKQYIEMEIQDITYRGGTILDIKTEATTMFGFQTMYILILYKMPDWDVLLDHF